MSGASTSAAAEGSTFQVDLKGVLYDAAVVPLAGTAFVLNLGTSEAKVGGQNPLQAHLADKPIFPALYLHCAGGVCDA